MYIFHLSLFFSYDLCKCSDRARSVFANSTVFVSGPKSALVVAMCCVLRLRSFHEPVMTIGLRFILPGLIWRDCILSFSTYTQNYQTHLNLASENQKPFSVLFY